MSEIRGLRLTTSAAVKEKRLLALLAGRPEAVTRAAVAEAQARGSLELAGRDATPAALSGYARAQQAVDPASAFTESALRAWSQALTGQGAFRAGERARDDGPPPAPAEFVQSRVAILEDWLRMDSSRELKAQQTGALVLARVLEILPFEQANGLVARLAASHVLVRAGARPPILTAADGARLDACLQAAWRFETEGLVALLEEASERALDVMIAALQPGG
jgi:hypothetical protein